MNGILLDFPVREISFNLPGWILSLDNEHWLRKDLVNAIMDSFQDRSTVQNVYDAAERFGIYDFKQDFHPGCQDGYRRGQPGNEAI